MREVLEGSGVVAQFRFYSGICLEALRKARKASDRIASVPDEIRTDIVLNVSLQRYHHLSLVSAHILSSRFDHPINIW
jgi:hypothetical protein